MPEISLSQAKKWTFMEERVLHNQTGAQVGDHGEKRITGISSHKILSTKLLTAFWSEKGEIPFNK